MSDYTEQEFTDRKTTISNMSNFLPKKVFVTKSPDVANFWRNDNDDTSIKMETIELNTVDLINVFLILQDDAVKKASEIKNKNIRHKAIMKIKNMVYFGK